MRIALGVLFALLFLAIMVGELLAPMDFSLVAAGADPRPSTAIPMPVWPKALIMGAVAFILFVAAGLPALELKRMKRNGRAERRHARQ
jgi:hypothetical protein